MSDAPYVLSKEDRQLFLSTMKQMKIPTHYCSSLHSKISKGKLSGLKSHDYHVLMEDIIPVCMRDVGDASMAKVIIWLSRLFKRICAKTVDMFERESLFEVCAETSA